MNVTEAGNTDRQTNRQTDCPSRPQRRRTLSSERWGLLVPLFVPIAGTYLTICPWLKHQAARKDKQKRTGRHALDRRVHLVAEFS